MFYKRENITISEQNSTLKLFIVFEVTFVVSVKEQI